MAYPQWSADPWVATLVAPHVARHPDHLDLPKSPLSASQGAHVSPHPTPGIGAHVVFAQCGYTNYTRIIPVDSLTFIGLPRKSPMEKFMESRALSLSLGQWGKCLATTCSRSRRAAMPLASSGAWNKASTLSLQPRATATSSGVFPQMERKMPCSRSVSGSKVSRFLQKNWVKRWKVEPSSSKIVMEERRAHSPLPQLPFYLISHWGHWLRGDRGHVPF